MKGWLNRLKRRLGELLAKRSRRIGIILLMGAGLLLGVVLALLLNHAPEEGPVDVAEVAEEPLPGDGRIFTTLLQDLGRNRFSVDISSQLLEEVCPGDAQTSSQQELDLNHYHLWEMKSPSPGKRVTDYGWYRHPRFGDWRFNPGLDYAGEEVLASLGGRVVEIHQDSDAGYSLLLEHSTYLATRYSNLHEIQVQYGEMVEQGQQLALQNGEGRIHFHFQVLEEGTPLDPGFYLSQGK